MTMSLQVPFYTAVGEAQGKIDLPETPFAQPGSLRVLHETIRALQANRRRGTSETKTRGLVSGGGRKPWKQKGTGNARAGSNRSPLWRKGGIIFGPHPRSYRIEVGQVKKLAALQTALAAKTRDAELSVIDSLAFPESKTREAFQIFKKTGLPEGILLVIEKKDGASLRALRNIGNLRLIEAAELNAWHVLSARQVLFTKAALDTVANRFPKG